MSVNSLSVVDQDVVIHMPSYTDLGDGIGQSVRQPSSGHVKVASDPGQWAPSDMDIGSDNVMQNSSVN